MILTEFGGTLAAHREKQVVAVVVAIAYTTEETYQLVIVFIASHTSLTFLKFLTKAEIVIREEIIVEVGVPCIETLIHVLLIAITYKSVKAMLVVECLTIIGGHLKVIALAIRV